MEGRVTPPNFLKFLCEQGGQQWQITNIGYLISPTVSLANKDEGQRQQGPTYPNTANTLHLAYSTRKGGKHDRCLA